MSATSIRNGNKPFDSENRPALREADSRDRFNFRTKAVDGESERPRDSRNNTLRPKRADGEDSDGWSTVKPRKSFGTEGAERFNGRMGVDRTRDERRFKDREERDGKDKPRGFDTFSRDKDADHDQDRERDSRRNGTGRGRNEILWRERDNNEPPSTPRDRNSNGERMVDRSRGWREKERDERAERGADRGERGDRTERADRGDRRWDRDRDQRQERQPEWADTQVDEKATGHTKEDFQKWMEQMQGKDKASKAPVEDVAPQTEPTASFFELEPKKVETPLAIDTGPDKFFGMWSAPKEDTNPDSGLEIKQEGPTKAKTVGKASRFTSFFTPQEEPQRRQTEPPAALAPATSLGGLGALLSGSHSAGSEDKEAFDRLMQKLKASTASSTPPVNESQQRRPPPVLEKPQGIISPQPESFHQYRPERQEELRPSTRNSQQALQDFVAQRQMTGSQPTVRPEQVIQDLVGQRHTASARPDQPQSRNSNTEFLMGLMQSAKAAPEPQRTEQVLLRMPPKVVPDLRQIQQEMLDRQQEMQLREVLQQQRERSASQRQQGRPQPPPGFYEDPPAFQRVSQHERSNNPPQPTQILQRPPPPGLDIGWDRQAQLQQQQQQHRIPQNIAPPPGLANGGPSRGMPMPQMYPPAFPMGSFPPPDVMAGPPRNMQMNPPPGFFSPPGFMPPGMGGGFQEMAYGGGPFDGRGPPPQGAYRRQ